MSTDSNCHQQQMFSRRGAILALAVTAAPALAAERSADLPACAAWRVYGTTYLQIVASNADGLVAWLESLKPKYSSQTESKAGKYPCTIQVSSVMLFPRAVIVWDVIQGGQEFRADYSIAWDRAPSVTSSSRIALTFTALRITRGTWRPDSQDVSNIAFDVERAANALILQAAKESQSILGDGMRVELRRMGHQEGSAVGAVIDSFP